MKLDYTLDVNEAASLAGDRHALNALGLDFVNHVAAAIAAADLGNGRNIVKSNVQLDVLGVLYEPDGRPAKESS